MANLWTKKNPFLSMFLSSANVAVGKARGSWLQQARRNQTTAVKPNFLPETTLRH